jgi:lipopolysaccharide export system permease protein
MKIKILDRYVIKEFVRYLLIFLLGVIFIFIIVNFFEQIDKFVSKKASLEAIAKYYAYQIPYLTNLLLPVAELLAVFFAIGDMARRFELLAIKAAGVDMYRIFVPILIVGFINSAFSFWLGGHVAGAGMRKSFEVKMREIEKRSYSLHRTFARNLSFLGKGGRLFFFGTINAVSNSVSNVMIMDFKKGKVIRRIDARSGRFKNGVWTCYSVVERDFSGDSIIVREYLWKKYPEIKEKPFEFLKVSLELQEMSLPQLYAHRRALREAGLDCADVNTEIQYRFAFPLINFIILIFALPLASSLRGHGKAYGFGLAVSLAFVYWNFIQIFKVLGQTGELSPILSAWIPNVVFLITGIFLNLRVQR